jgi:hypothetical protein
MPRRTYDLADAYFALEGKESLSAVATVLREGLATQAFLDALASRLSPLPRDEAGEFELVLVKRKNGQPVQVAKRAQELALRLAVREAMLNARANDADIEPIVAEIMAKTGRSRSWIFEAAK